MKALYAPRSISEEEVLNMIEETSQLAAQENIQILSGATMAAQSSNSLASNVEFWKWMDRNFHNSGIFDSASSMQQYISQGAGKEEWLLKQLQGKGYEWDWMEAQRNSFKNILQRYDAGDVATRAASDVTKTDLLTGKTMEYQHKAYTSKTNPNLKNTPKDMTIVTNAEKVEVVRQNGYEKVEQFQDSETILKNRQKRMDDIKSGKVSTSYNIRNVAGSMAKAGAVAAVVGMGTESIVLYRQYKSGALTGRQYLEEVVKSGGDAGVTAAATAGIMVPVSSVITVAGIATPVTIPIAVVVGGTIGQIISPCFGRGKYRKILAEARYYQNLDAAYLDLITSMEAASEQYYNYIYGLNQQFEIQQKLKAKNREVDRTLKELYDSI